MSYIHTMHAILTRRCCFFFWFLFSLYHVICSLNYIFFFFIIFVQFSIILIRLMMLLSLPMRMTMLICHLSIFLSLFFQLMIVVRFFVVVAISLFHHSITTITWPYNKVVCTKCIEEWEEKNITCLLYDKTPIKYDAQEFHPFNSACFTWFFLSSIEYLFLAILAMYF